MKTARSLLATETGQAKLTKLKVQVEEESSQSVLARTMLVMASSEGLEERFATIERDDNVEALLLELEEGSSASLRGSHWKERTFPKGGQRQRYQVRLRCPGISACEYAGFASFRRTSSRHRSREPGH